MSTAPSFEQTVQTTAEEDSGSETHGYTKDAIFSVLEANLPRGYSSDDSNSLCGAGLLMSEACFSPNSHSLNGENKEIPSASLVVGDAFSTKRLQELIMLQTVEHEIQVCVTEDAFRMANTTVYQLIWLLMSVPASQDTLSLTTSIRYASKCNRNTVILGVADSPLEVDLHLHGIDEIAVQPVTKVMVRKKYTRWTSVLLSKENDDLETAEVDSVSTSIQQPTTTSEVDKDTYLSRYASVNTTLDLKASLSELQNFPTLHTTHLEYQASTTTATTIGMNDHTTKEKLRRERIKDSCDQLRVLLPYIRGRKTDMASILEMCVDYLKIVTAVLPQEFQNQITDILSKECKLTVRTCADQKAVRRGSKRSAHVSESPSSGSKMTSTVEKNNNDSVLQLCSNSEMFSYAGSAQAGEDITKDAEENMMHGIPKKENNENFKCSIKRPKQQQSEVVNQHNIGYMYTQASLPNSTNVYDHQLVKEESMVRMVSGGTEDSMNFQVSNIQMSPAPIYQSMGDNTSRVFQQEVLSADGFPSTYLGNHSSMKPSDMGRDIYRTAFMEPPPMFPYYNNLQTSTMCQTEYTTTSPVVPISYTARFPMEKYEDLDRQAKTKIDENTMPVAPKILSQEIVSNSS